MSERVKPQSPAGPVPGRLYKARVAAGPGTSVHSNLCPYTLQMYVTGYLYYLSKTKCCSRIVNSGLVWKRLDDLITSSVNFLCARSSGGFLPGVVPACQTVSPPLFLLQGGSLGAAGWEQLGGACRPSPPASARTAHFTCLVYYKTMDNSAWTKRHSFCFKIRNWKSSGHMIWILESCFFYSMMCFWNITML